MVQEMEPVLQAASPYREFIGFGIQTGEINGVVLCRLFNRIIAGTKPSTLLNVLIMIRFSSSCLVALRNAGTPLQCAKRKIGPVQFTLIRCKQSFRWHKFRGCFTQAQDNQCIHAHLHRKRIRIQFVQRYCMSLKSVTQLNRNLHG